MLDRKDRLYFEIAARSAYLVLAVASFLATLGFWDIWSCTGGGFNVWFFTNYFDWTLILSIIATAAALVEDFRIVKNGGEGFTKKFPFLKFTAFSGMIFGLVLGALLIDRIGTLRLTDSTAFGSVFPAIATKGYWLDFSLLTSMCLCPAGYIAIYILFEGKGVTRPSYETLGIVMPTLFYLTDKIFGIVMSAVYGGADGLVAAGMYGVAYPFFFYDDLTFSGWWWILIWPSAFGVGLVVINKGSYYISRLKRDASGKIRIDKTPYDEDSSCDMFHPIAAKYKAWKQSRKKKQA